MLFTSVKYLKKIIPFLMLTIMKNIQNTAVLSEVQKDINCFFKMIVPCIKLLQFNTILFKQTRTKNYTIHECFSYDLDFRQINSEPRFFSRENPIIILQPLVYNH